MKIRRVVTGLNEKGQSIVKWDSEIEGIAAGRPGISRFPMWKTKELPAKLTDEDPNTWETIAMENGSTFHIVKYDPGVSPRRHTTATIDYALVLSGEIDMQLDKGEVHLKAGDVLIQRGTIHNWVNRGTEPCVIAFILIAAEGVKATG